MPRGHVPRARCAPAPGVMPPGTPGAFPAQAHYSLLQGYFSDMKRMKPALAPSFLRAASAITQLTNAFMVSLRLGAGVGRQIFDPPGFSRSVCRTPWANPLQKFSRAELPGLTGLAEQATARSPAVLVLILTGAALGGAAAAGTAHINARMMIGRMLSGQDDGSVRPTAQGRGKAHPTCRVAAVQCMPCGEHSTRRGRLFRPVRHAPALFTGVSHPGRGSITRRPWDGILPHPRSSAPATPLPSPAVRRTAVAAAHRDPPRGGAGTSPGSIPLPDAPDGNDDGGRAAGVAGDHPGRPRLRARVIGVDTLATC
jgi:hypothetical protein